MIKINLFINIESRCVKQTIKINKDLFVIKKFDYSWDNIYNIIIYIPIIYSFTFKIYSYNFSTEHIFAIILKY